MISYDHRKIESKWQKTWRKAKLYSPNLDTAKKPFYNLMMFPYPSAEGLHVGNMYAFTGSDIYGRYKRMTGFDVFEPIGLDGFGIHSENFAIKVNRNPKKQAKISEKNFYRQLAATGNAYDWDRTLETYDPAYYKWTQWIFIQLFKAGLAYRAKSTVNFCPSCKTVLADEQVVSKSKVESQKSKVEEKIAVCERCETPVERRELEQWFFKITDYADKLLEGLTRIDWSERVKIAQRNWIGKKEGVTISYQVAGSRLQVECWTSRPDTNFGATFVVLSYNYPQVLNVTKRDRYKEVEQYIKISQSKTNEDRIAEGREKTGVFTGLYAINNLTGEKMPIWVSDFVLMEFGTGAVVGVPGHDKRDFEFAKKFKLPIRRVVVGKDGDRSPIVGIEQVQEEEGTMVNSDFLNGLDIDKAKVKIMDYLEKKGWGKRQTTYHLRDWLISRQRYWGPPIPMIFCQKCAGKGESWFTSEEAKVRFEVGSAKWETRRRSGKLESKYPTSHLNNPVSHLPLQTSMPGWFPIPEDQLPVLLPDVKDWRPNTSADGLSIKGPLANHPEFYNVACPNCGSQARRETDVSDTFLDSAWYYLGYLTLKNQPFDFAQGEKSKIKNQKFRISSLEFRNSLAKRGRWLPVDMYIGGAEHAVLHLLYTRFLWKVFYDFGYFSVKSPKGQLGGPAKMPASGWEEPFTKFRAHGLLIAKGAKMSKSKGNIVNPDDYIEKYGADALRCYLMFCGRFKQGGDFSDAGIEGMSRFLKRVWRLVVNARGPVSSFPPAPSINSGQAVRVYPERGRRAVGSPSSAATPRMSSLDLQLMHQTIRQVTKDIESLDYNTAISALMIWLRTLEQHSVKSAQSTYHSSSLSLRAEGLSLITREEVKNFLLLLAPFAPHMTEELWQQLKVRNAKTLALTSRTLHTSRTSRTFHSIHLAPWPKYDAKLAEAGEIELVVEVNGKVRDKIAARRGLTKEEAEKLALSLPKIQNYLSGKKYKAIYVDDRLINLVT